MTTAWPWRICVLSALFGGGFSAHAQVAGPAGAGGPPTMETCRPAIEKLCKNVEPGEGRIIKCLDAHRKDLPKTCMAVLDRVKRQQAQFEEACGSDVRKLCAGETGGNRPGPCLRRNEKKLSPGCKSLLEERQRRMQAGGGPGGQGGPRGPNRPGNRKGGSEDE